LKFVINLSTLKFVINLSTLKTIDGSDRSVKTVELLDCEELLWIEELD